MIRYTKQCPYCRKIIQTDYTVPGKRLGDPIVRCRYCLNHYVDNNVYEWAVSPLYRKISYCLANYRALICFMAYFIASYFVVIKFNQPIEYAFAMCTPILLCTFLLCALYVKHELKYEIENSYRRAADKKHIELLKQTGYPLSKQYNRNKNL